MPALELPELNGDNVVLRGWEPGDVAALRPACGDPAICRFTTVPLSYTPDGALQWIERQRAHAELGDAAVLAVVPSGHDQPVGMAGLFGLGEPEATARFGYWVERDWRRRGLAIAACRLLATWGFKSYGLSAIHIDRERENAASAAVAERLGAVITGSRTVAYDGAEVELIRHTVNAPVLGRFSGPSR